MGSQAVNVRCDSGTRLRLPWTPASMLVGLMKLWHKLLGWVEFLYSPINFTIQRYLNFQLLALFEVSSHPRHSSERSTSSMLMLDSIIRSLSLTLVDADDPSASMFSPGTVPVVSSPKPRAAWSPEQPPTSPDVHFGADGHVAALPTQSHRIADNGCNCHRFTLGEHWPSGNDYAPMWGSTPAWDEAWSEGDIRKESCRRLCWSSMILAAGHISYTTAHGSQGLDLFIADPANVSAFFLFP
jgi:hypothetical protein